MSQAILPPKNCLPTSTRNGKLTAATVYMNMEVTGLSDVVLHAMNELGWRKIAGQWLCYYTVGMRGSPGNTGGIG
ncbi:hypothetical protein CLAFUW4_05145 [Fulvia fulva]|uniref:Uncharacterized protein n=1 Tax=Passalora fulva TaxID=5499 RepID=A0A9Q8UU29_PASFU|nr:uncharacterized protein CLAFUR5_11760 [Fulvia fulva]KAK4626676.1 hypothetical protein CLAFUR4_05131 [Fulvia fulva]KAK4627480.1 hypothetical protein CLAFUR0_05137 [Fulvia fulva]UJO22448.1 hypothetical protein CLAFUR5_11760 [Fulvia fulva]WPV14091.1 hypothetical protein CLAFUW4_05145 [Fulvia fulva]WPV29127.1 hypothetical protein CLAFUW7_05141 [Fulvia fulva]